jgi:hypothetical protein
MINNSLNFDKSNSYAPSSYDSNKFADEYTFNDDLVDFIHMNIFNNLNNNNNNNNKPSANAHQLKRTNSSLKTELAYSNSNKITRNDLKLEDLNCVQCKLKRIRFNGSFCGKLCASKFAQQ